jgi:signal peptidase I
MQCPKCGAEQPDTATCGKCQVVIANYLKYLERQQTNPRPGFILNNKEHSVNDKPRRPWVAAILTFPAMGLGHFYAGEPKRGLYFFGIELLLLVAIACAALLVSTNIIFVIIVSLIYFAYTIYCAIDAASIARRHKDTYQLKSYNKWCAYIAYYVVLSYIISPFVAMVIKSNIVEAFKIPASSMVPTLLIGDHILVNNFEYGPRIPLTDLRIFTRKKPEHGEIIVFKYPEDETKNFIKRVIGVPGDKIQIYDGTLFINDQPVPLEENGYVRVGERNPSGSTDAAKTRTFKEQVGGAQYQIQYLHDQRGYNYGPVIVPDESFFVMGDNRDFSQDSRFWGFVKFSKVLGRARSIYWSWDNVSSKVRWDRIGNFIQ